MRAVKVTASNVKQIMSALGITDDMLMCEPVYDLCPISASKESCIGECERYGLSKSPSQVGYNRGGACVLFRLHRISKANNSLRLYAPDYLLECECEDI